MPVDVVHPDGRTARVGSRRVESMRADGWRPATEDAGTPAARPARPAGPPGVAVEPAVETGVCPRCGSEQVDVDMIAVPPRSCRVCTERWAGLYDSAVEDPARVRAAAAVRHVGGGWWQLPSGERVQGRDAAIDRALAADVPLSAPSEPPTEPAASAAGDDDSATAEAFPQGPAPDLES